MLVRIFTPIVLLMGILVADFKVNAEVLPLQINCKTINDDLNLIEQLEDSGELRDRKSTPQKLVFDYSSDLPYEDYLAYARNKIVLTNPKGEMLCPIQTATSQLLYPNLDQDLQLVVDLLAPFQLDAPPSLAADSNVGILLIHGLTDSPYLFHDLAYEFYKLGITVRTLMLPGHGTAPDALLETTEKQWRDATRYAMKQMVKDFDTVLLGGFSTGGALIVDQLVHGKWTKPELEQFKGVLMWSPASKAKSDYAWVAKYVDYLPYVDYINTGADIDFAKYESFPFNAAAQVHKLMNRLSDEDRPWNTIPDIPMFIVASEIDQTIDTKQTLVILNQWNRATGRMTSNQDTLIYYGHWKTLDTVSQNVNIHIPECESQQLCSKVLGVSHNAATNSPKNPHYGFNGHYKYCEHHFGDEAYNACKTMPVAPIGEITEQNLEQNPVLRRLTFNPYFDHMVEKLTEFVQEATREIHQ